jgi:hypothetical protein
MARKYNKSTGRNYKKDYEKFQSSPAQIKARSERNKRRRKLEKQGKVRKGDGKDVHHKGSSVKVMDKEKNRGIREKSRLKGSKRK